MKNIYISQYLTQDNSDQWNMFWKYFNFKTVLLSEEEYLFQPIFDTRLPTNINVSSGDTAYLRCRAYNRQHKTVSWDLCKVKDWKQNPWNLKMTSPCPKSSQLYSNNPFFIRLVGYVETGPRSLLLVATRTSVTTDTLPYTCRRRTRGPWSSGMSVSRTMESLNVRCNIHYYCFGWCQPGGN